MPKKLLLMISFILVFISSIAYSALSTSLSITSEVKFRVLADIRINGIELNNADGATLAYESEYSKNTVSNGFTLPTAGSSISYTVHVDNSGDVDYSIYDILKTSSDNGLNVAVSGYNLQDIIPARTSVDLVLTYTTSNPSNSVINVVNTFDFKRVYYITYETGTSQIIPQQIKYQGVNLTLTSTQPTKNGYTFSKWNTKSDGSGVNYNSGASYTVDDDQVLYARYNLATYNITYVLDGGTNHANNPSTYTILSNDITLGDATKTGYTFKGWTGNGTTTPTKNLVLPTGSYGDKTFTANFADETDPVITVTSHDETINYLTTARNFDAGWNATSAAITYKINATDDGSGIDTIEYAITNSATAPTTGWTSTANGTYSDTKARGTYYIHVRATDVAGNTTTVSTKAMTVRFRVAYYDYFNSDTTNSGNQYYTGTALTSRTPTAHTGYDFGGWYNSTALTTKVVDANTSYTPSSSIQLYGKWSPKNYSITYTMNNGTNNANNPNSYNIESAAITLQAPTKTLTFHGNVNSTSGANAASGQVTIENNDQTAAQTFAGWTGSNGTTAQTTVTIPTGSTGDKSYTAHWTAVAPSKLPKVTRTGYTCGWSTSSTGTTIEYASEATNYPTSAISEGQAATVNLYAVCTPKTYTLTIVPQDGTYNSSTSNATKTMTYDSTNNNDIGVPTRNGYTFAGWYTAANGGTQLFGTDGHNVNANGYWSAAYNTGVWKYDGNVTVYAKWTKAVNTLTNSVSPTSYIYDGTAKTPTPTVKDGNTTLTNNTDYTVAYTNNTNVGTATATITGAGVYNSTTKAYYTGTATVNYYINNAKITFDANSCGTITGTSPAYVRKNATGVYDGLRSSTAGTVPTVSKAGYSFQGWYDGNTKIINSNGSVVASVSSWTDSNSKWLITEDKSLTAHCTREDYAITYTMNNGTNNANNPNSYNVESAAITLQAPTKTLTFHGNVNSTSGANAASGQVTIENNDQTAAQTFAGWTGSNGTTAQTTVTIPSGSTGNKSYTAHWTAVAPAKLPKVTRTGYTCGWSTSSTGTTIQYASEATNYPTSAISEGQAATVNLYAVCTPKTYTLTIVPQDGTYNSSTSNATKTMTYDSTNNNDIGTPTRSGYTFAGWYTAASGGTQLFGTDGHNVNANGYWSAAYNTGVWKYDGNVTVYAKWTKAVNTLTNSVSPTSYIYDGTAKTPTPTVKDGNTTLTNNTDYTVAYTNNTNVGTATATITGAGVYNATTKAYYTGTTTVSYYINNAKLTFNVGSCASVSGTTPLYTKKGATVVYTGIRETTTTGTIPTASKTGYTFQGWYTATSNGSKVLNANGTFTGTGVTNYTDATTWQTVADQNLYAVCTPSTYTLTINPNGGTYNSTTSNSTKTMTYDSSNNNDIGVPTRTGYTFLGWYTDATNGTQIYGSNGRNVNASGYWSAAYNTGVWKKDSNVTVYAHWQINKYYLTYDYQDDYTYNGANALDTGYKYNWDKNFRIETTFRIDSLGKRYALCADKNYKLNFEVSASNKLRVYLNDGAIDSYSSNAVVANTDITAVFTWNASTKAWTATATGTGVNISMSGTYDGLSGLSPNTVLVGRDARTNVFNPITISMFKISEEYDYNSTVTPLPTVSKPGYEYSGWYDASTGGNKVTSVTIPASDKTIYARSTAKIYSVTLDNQDATTAGTTKYYYQYKTTKVINNVTCYYYTDSALTTCLTNGYYIDSPTKTGYTFGGYYTSTGGSGTQYIDAQGGGVNNIYLKVPSEINNSYTDDITLYAKWTPKTYTLTINPNGGTYNSSTSNATKTMTYDSTNNNDIGVPTRDGYTFAGWYTAENGGTQLFDTSGHNTNASSYWTAAYSTGKWKYDGNVTVYAKWTKAVSTLTNTLSQTNYIYNGSAQGPTVTVKDGSTTLTLNTDYTVSGNSNTNVGQYSVTVTGKNAYNSTTKAYYTGTTTLTYNINNAKLTFDAGSCTTVSGTTPLYTKKGATVVYTGIRETTTTGTIPTASKSGYTFQGWYTASSGGSKVLNANGTFTGTAVTNYTNATTWQTVADQTLYAQCTRDSYSITYTMNNGTNNANNPSTYTVESAAITLAAPTKTLTFHGNVNSTSGANAASGQVTIENNDQTAVQTFAGWTGSNGSTAQTSVTIASGSTGNKSYTAHWTAVAPAKLPKVTRTGYTCGWSTSSTGTTIQYASEATNYPTSAITEGQAATVNLYAVCTPKTYTLTINPQNGTYAGSTSNATKTMTYDSTNNNDISTPTRSGYTFAGWYTAANGGTQLFGTDGHNVNANGYWSAAYNTGVWKYDGNVTVYAKWTKAVGDLTKSVSPTSYIYDGTAKIPTPSVSDGSTALTNNTDYTVAYTNNTNVGTATATITGAGVYNATTKAYYTGTTTVSYYINNAKLTFNVGSCASVSGTSPLYTKKTATKVYTEIRGNTEGTIPTASKTGYTFQGWYTASSGGSKVINANRSFTGTAVTGYVTTNAWDVTEDKTLYAQCTPTNYTVTANANGGSISSTSGWTGTGNTATKSVAYDAAYGTLPNVSKSGYTFQGWTHGILVPSKRYSAWVEPFANNSFVTTNLSPSTSYTIEYDVTLNEAIPSGYSASQTSQWGNIGIRTGTSTYSYNIAAGSSLYNVSGANYTVGTKYHITATITTPADLSTAILVFYTARSENSSSQGYVINGTFSNVVFYENTYTYGPVTTTTTVKIPSSHTINADWTINNPATPTISGGTTKVYGSNATTLTCSEGTTYASGTTKYYSFGYASSDGGTPSNWTTASTSATLNIGAQEYVGQRWYSCRVYASDGTQTTSTVTSAAASDTEMTINNAKITWDANNCGTLSGTNPAYVKKGTTGVLNGIRSTTAGTMASVSKTGYTFNGWYDGTTKVINADGTIVASVSNWTDASKNWLISADKTLKASCSAKTYTLTINPQNGTYNSSTNNSSKTMTYDSTNNNDIGVPTRDGYTFGGWYTAASGGTQVYGADGHNTNASGYWSAAYNTGKWVYDGNLTVYARWTKAVSDLTKSVNPTSYIYDGSAKTPTPSVSDGSTALTNNTDYTVSYSNNTNVGTATATITGAGVYNSTTKAFYTGTATVNYYINNAKITYSANNCGTITGTSPAYVKKGTTGVYTEIRGTTAGTVAGLTAKTGYTFNGWYDGSTKVINSDGTIVASVSNWTDSSKNWLITADKTLTASCSAKTYTLTINPQGGTYSGSTNNASKTMTYDSTNNNDIGVPTRSGYTFAGWYTAANGGTQVYGTNGQNVNASSYWTAAYNTGKWKYDGNLTVYAKWTKAVSDLTKSVNPTSYIYDGSAKTPTPSVSDGSTALTNNTDYTVAYTNNTNVGTATATITGAGVYNSTTKAYYTGTTTVSYYINNVTLTFDKGNCSSVSGTTPLYTKKGATAVYTGIRETSTTGTIPTGTPQTGYSFQGWYTASSNGSKVLNANGSLTGTAVSGYTTASAWDVTENKTLYARCAINQYTLTINPNGGSYNGTTSNTTVTQNYGTTYNVANNPTKAGYVFNGWQLSSGNGNITYFTDSEKLQQYLINSTSANKPGVYNNNGNGTVTHTNISDSTSSTGYSMRIVTNGSANPYAGGFINNISSTSGALYYHKIVAKIPTGYSLSIHNNSIGLGARNYWVTDNTGTGNWKTYIYAVSAGYNGVFNDFGHVALNGSNNTSVTWYINESTMYRKGANLSEVQASNLTFQFVNSNATLTALWNTSGSTVTFNTSNGSWDSNYVANWNGNGYTSVTSSTANRDYYYSSSYGTHPGSTNYNWTPDTRVISRSGYTFGGWYTAAGGSTQLFGTDGTLNASVSGYSDANKKWIKYDGNATVYAKWTKSVADSSVTKSVSPTSYIYDGSAKSPTPSVSDGSTALTKDTDYTVAYTNNTNVGTATATITGANVYNSTTKAYYNGSTTVSFYINNATLTFDKGSCSSVSGSTTLYTRKNATAVYTGIRETTTTGTIPTGTTTTGSTFIGWYTAASGGTKVLNANGTFTGTAVTNYTNASSWAVTANQTLYAQCSTNTYKLTKITSGTNNLLVNGSFDNYRLIDSQTFGNNHTWDKSLNGVPNNTNKSYHPYAWGSGLNSGVPVPEVGYHAHMRVVDGNAVFRYKTNEAYNGNTGSGVSGGTAVAGTVTTNRWLGVSQALNGADLTAGKTYAISMDIYRVSGGNYVNTGLYHSVGSETSRNFHSGTGNLIPTTTGQWERLTYTFTLSSNYNSAVAPYLYVYGDRGTAGELYVDNVSLEEVTSTDKVYNTNYTSTEVATVSKTGYTFGGWTNGKNNTALTTSTAFTTSTANFENVANVNTRAYIYAKWTPKTYTLTIDPNGGSYNNSTSTSTKTMTYGSSSNNDIGTPTRDGYTFAGWYTAANGGTQIYGTNGQNVNASSYWTAAYNTGSWKYDGNVTVYAKWTKAVSSLTNTLSQTNYIYTGSAQGPSTTVKDGSTTLTSGTDYTVSGNSNTNVGSYTVTITGASAYNSTTKAYYTGTTTLTYYINNAKLTFDKGDCTSTSGTTTLYTKKSATGVYTEIRGTTAGTLPTASKSNYTFQGWYTSNNGGGSKVLTGSNAFTGTAVSGYTTASAWDTTVDRTLYAHCTPNAITLTINPQGGTYNSSTSNSTKTMTIDSTNNNDIGVPTRDGYTFAGWYTAANGGTQLFGTDGKNVAATGYWSAAYSTGVWQKNENTTVYAKWTKAVSSLTNTLSQTNYIYTGSAQGPTATVKDGSTTLTLNSDYTVSGNSNTNVGQYSVTISGKSAYNSTTKAYYTGTTTLTYYINNAKLTFDKGTCSSVNGTTPLYTKKSATVVYDGIRSTTTATLPTATAAAGHTFQGWYTASSGGSKVLNADRSFTGTAVTGYTTASAWDTTVDRTLYAQCTADTHTVTYSCTTNEGTGTVASATVAYGNAITLPSTGCSKTGYDFIGWNTDSSATSALSSLNMGTGNITLYALYRKQITATLSTNTNTGASITPTSASCYLYNKASSCTVNITSINPRDNTWTAIGLNQTASATSNSSSYDTSTKKLSISSSGTWYPITRKTLTGNFTITDQNAATGGGTSTCNIYSYGASCNITAAALTAKSGYTAYGWSLSQNATSASYSSGATISINEDKQYYSVTSINTVISIKFNKNASNSRTVSQTPPGGSASDATEVTVSCNRYNGSDSCTIKSPTITAQTGYHGVGYNTSATATSSTWNQNTDKTISVSAHNTTYYAITAGNSYSIKFNANCPSGTTASGSMSDLAMTYGEAKNLTANAFSCTNRVFEGWTLNQNGTGTIYSDGASVQDIGTSGTVNLYAKWRLLISTPTLSGGATKIYGTTATQLTCTENTSSSVYPSGTVKKYAFTYTNDGSTPANDAWPAATTNNTLTIANNEYIGDRYYFCAVYAESSSESSFTAKSTSALVSITNVQVSFNSGGHGTITGTSPAFVNNDMSSVYTGLKNTDPGTMPGISNPSAGYVFAGWYTAASGGTKVVNTDGTLVPGVTNYTKSNGKWDLTSNTTLYAYYTYTTYTITYVCNNGIIGSDATCSPGSYNASQQVTLPTPTKVIEFKGNNNDTAGANAGAGTVSIGTNTSAEQTFAGWTGTGGNTGTTQPTNPTTPYSFGPGATGNRSYTANWTAVAPTSLPTVTRTGYTCGWNISQTGTTIQYASGATNFPTSHISSNGQSRLFNLWAVCTPITSTVSFSDNGGSGGVHPNVTATYDQAMPTISGYVAPTRSGYTLAGWYDTNASSGGTKYYNADGSSARTWNKTTSPVTLYARWTPNNYTITYHLDGGTNHSSNPSTYTYESATITLQAPTRPGYTFTGWTGSNGTTPQTTVTIPNHSTGNKEYTANWSANSYNITILGMVNGVVTSGTYPCGTYDLYINGSKVGENITSSLENLVTGSTYTIDDIQTDPSSACTYIGSNTYSGTIVDSSIDIYIPYTFTSKTFAYTGGAQEFIFPATGIYKLEVWGAAGGTATNRGTGGLGGYSYGNVATSGGYSVYVMVGQGGAAGAYTTRYNGGAKHSGTSLANAGTGGGATDIAKMPGVLTSSCEKPGDNVECISSIIGGFETPEDIFIVAGGGGGGSGRSGNNGGTGGGTTGGDGGGSYKGGGGTQTAGGSVYSSSESGLHRGAFGIGGAGETLASCSNDRLYGGGGGGGWYGGGGGGYVCKTANYSKVGGGGGGSGYLWNELTNTGMESGVRSGNGQATITWVSAAS